MSKQMCSRVELIHTYLPVINGFHLRPYYSNTGIKEVVNCFWFRLYNFHNLFWRENKCLKLNALSKFFSTMATRTPSALTIWDLITPSIHNSNGFLFYL